VNKKLILKIASVGVLLVGVYGYTRIEQTKPIGFHITSLDIGQGDSELIQFRDGEKMLVDCGPDKKVLERLGTHLSSNDRTIDYLLITHPHLDHYGGCIDVLKRYTIKHIVYNTVGSDKDSYWHTWNEAMRNSKAELLVMNHADRWTIASTSLEFLAPDPSLNFHPAASDVNDTSIVFRLTDEPTKTSVLFTGDMEEPLEKALLRRYCTSSTTPDGVQVSSSTSKTLSSAKKTTSTPEKNVSFPCPALHADILKAGHHGSDTSSSEDFLKAVQPKTAVISCGINNKFHHPSLRTVKRMEHLGITILRTDQKGDILVE
jgi:competence protein ComEC